jgi:xylulokinase
MKKTVLAIDIGTSSIKAAIINNNGELLSWGRSAFVESRMSEQGWNTEIWPETLKKVLKRIEGLHKTDAVVVSGNGPTLISLRGDGSYSDDPYLWMDKRKTPVKGMDSFYLPAVLWMKNNSPDEYRKTSSLIPLESFIPYLLTGSLKVPLPNDEFRKYIWDKDEINSSGLDIEKFPDFVKTGDSIGSVTLKASSEFGIAAGVPVFAGGSDYLMALLGTGAVSPGTVCDRAGTSEGINYCSAQYKEYKGLRCLPHVVDGLYNVSALLTSSGRIFEWFRRMSGKEQMSYIELIAEIQKVILSESDLYFFPSLKKGAVWDFSGGAMIGLEPEHGMREAGSAVVKSIGFAVRSLIEKMEMNGLVIDNIRMSGGQARNALWNQMKSDMTGKTILVPEICDGELLGCACTGFFGLGEFGSLLEGSEKLIRLKDEYHPDMFLYEKYSVLYRRYSEINSKITSLFESISTD